MIMEEHTRKTCFMAYLLKKVKKEKGTEGFDSKPFGNDISNNSEKMSL